MKSLTTLDTPAAATDTRNPGYQELKGRDPPGSPEPAESRSPDPRQREDAEPEIRAPDRRHAGSRTRHDAAQPLRAREHRRRRAARALRPRPARSCCCTIRRSRTSSSTASTRSTSSGTAGSSPPTLPSRTSGTCMQIIERIVSSIGRRIDESSPMVDARLADGSRVNAIIPPLALDGAGAVDPALPDRQTRCATTSLAASRWTAADETVPRGGRRVPPERRGVRRHRRRQDDAAEHPLQLHSATTSAS